MHLIVNCTEDHSGFFASLKFNGYNQFKVLSRQSNDGNLVNNVIVCVGSQLVCVEKEVLPPSICENFQTISGPY